MWMASSQMLSPVDILTIKGYPKYLFRHEIRWQGIMIEECVCHLATAELHVDGIELRHILQLAVARKGCLRGSNPRLHINATESATTDGSHSSDLDCMLMAASHSAASGSLQMLPGLQQSPPA